MGCSPWGRSESDTTEATWQQQQAPPSMGFSRQEYWSGVPFPSPGDLPNPEIEPGSPALQADSLPTEPLGKADSQSLTSVLTFQDNISS